MTEKKGDLIEQIRSDLQKSGFPLEIKVMKLLKQFDWRVIPQHYYVDPDEEKGRSLDFCCIKRVEVNSSYVDALRFIVLIECKKTKENWVFFVTRKSPLNEKMKLIMFHPTMHIKFKKPRFPLIEAFRHSHYMNYKKVAINHYVPFKKKAEKDVKDSFYEACQQVLKALIDDRICLERFDIPKLHLCSFYYPIIITDKPIIEYDIETDKISRKNRILYSREGISRWLEPFRIDVLRFEAAHSLLKEINDEMQKITEYLKQFT